MSLPRKIKGSLSYWLLIAAVGLFVLQLIPITGLFVMFMGAGIINAVLIYLFLAALLLESAIGRVPRVLAVVPIVAVGAYYWAYQEQIWLIAEETAKLKSINIGKAMDFDSSTASLVFDDNNFTQLAYFVENHRIPVAYDGFNAARMISYSDCTTIKNNNNRAFLILAGAYYYNQTLVQNPVARCVLLTKEQPTKSPVYVKQADHASSKLKLLGISEPSTDVVVNGKIVGSLRKIVVHRVSPYLWFVGCAFSDSPAAWVCTTSFFQEREEVIYSDPPSAAVKEWFDDQPGIYDLACILLGIPKYTTDDLLHFTGYSVNAAIVALAQTPAPPPQ